MDRRAASFWAVCFLVFTSAVDRAAALDQPIDGLRLIAGRSHTGKEKLVYDSEDPRLLFPEFESSDDPTIAGASIDLISPVEGLHTLTIPAGDPAWTKKSGATDLYVYRASASSDVRKVVLRRDGGVRVLARRAVLPMTSVHGQVGFRLRTGSLRNCTLFGPDSLVMDVPSRLIAYDASGSAVSDCEERSLGGAYCDVVTPCPEGQFCEMPAGICASALDAGTCVDASPACPQIYDPECGCDGMTYSNSCERRAAKVQKSVDGSCAECLNACDCYVTHEFADECAMLCPMCGNYWRCEKNQCVENCGPLPGKCEDL